MIVIPRKGVESYPAVVNKNLPYANVIPRKGVESSVFLENRRAGVTE